jgi:hypothetical protein
MCPTGGRSSPGVAGCTGYSLVGLCVSRLFRKVACGPKAIGVMVVNVQGHRRAPNRECDQPSLITGSLHSTANTRNLSNMSPPS